MFLRKVPHPHRSLKENLKLIQFIVSEKLTTASFLSKKVVIFNPENGCRIYNNSISKVFPDIVEFLQLCSFKGHSNPGSKKSQKQSSQVHLQSYQQIFCFCFNELRLRISKPSGLNDAFPIFSQFELRLINHLFYLYKNLIFNASV